MLSSGVGSVLLITPHSLDKGLIASASIGLSLSCDYLSLEKLAFTITSLCEGSISFTIEIIQSPHPPCLPRLL